MSWQPDFDFYDADLEGTRVAVFFDLAARAHAPVRTHTLRFHVRVELAIPNPDGLHSEEEHAMLVAAEDTLAAKLSERAGAIYVGRLASEGRVVFTFYVPKEREGDLADPRALVGDGVPYVLEWTSADDPEWLYYRELLWPDSETEKKMNSRRAADKVLGVGQA